jgi:hypothetical protein
MRSGINAQWSTHPVETSSAFCSEYFLPPHSFYGMILMIDAIKFFFFVCCLGVMLLAAPAHTHKVAHPAAACASGGSAVQNDSTSDNTSDNNNALIAKNCEKS